jgi:enhancing lycopene biosynthesis protein 2
MLCKPAGVESIRSLLEQTLPAIYGNSVRNAQRHNAPTSRVRDSWIGKDHVRCALDRVMVASANQVVNRDPVDARTEARRQTVIR